mmetsp:Transcript_14445/g.62668  ORF Transcript_14445/g.62668 Transcript_14445/m.62668 type:complete len:210 (-) Transcript_14445:483-1112(-)
MFAKDSTTTTSGWSAGGGGGGGGGDGGGGGARRVPCSEPMTLTRSASSIDSGSSPPATTCRVRCMNSAKSSLAREDAPGADTSCQMADKTPCSSPVSWVTATSIPPDMASSAEPVLRSKTSKNSSRSASDMRGTPRRATSSSASAVFVGSSVSSSVANSSSGSVFVGSFVAGAAGGGSSNFASNAAGAGAAGGESSNSPDVFAGTGSSK